MDEIRIPVAGDPFYQAGKRTGSTRHHRVDEAFIEVLEEDFGIDAYSRTMAFMGVPPEPKKAAIALCEWAARTDDPAGALLAWAKKRGRGRYGRRLVEAPPATFRGREAEGV